MTATVSTGTPADVVGSATPGPPTTPSDRWRGEAPIFSILVPVWHPEPAHLQACVASVSGQTTAEWELILSIDGPQPAETERALVAAV
ncbi:MAG: hypothetical protein AAFO29_02525, partial [Actinomycetota bacterium]